MINGETGQPLAALLEDVPGLTVCADAGGTHIRGIVYDSRGAAPGYLFCALTGIHTDGHAYIAQAVKAGAAAILCGRPPAEELPGVVYILARDARAAMSRISANFYGRPCSRLKIIGVTGTDGKSSTVSFISQLLEAAGKKTGLLSTVSVLAGGQMEKNTLRQSTPEAPVIHAMLAQMQAAGREFAVIEATSHGLSPRTGRLLDVEFDAAVLTNVTHEHLEFHGSLRQYLSDKTNLFRGLDARRSARKGIPAFGVANADDSSYAYIKGQTREKLFSYSLQNAAADVYAADLACDMSGSSFILHDGGRREQIHICLPGAFNVENVLAAAAAASRILGICAADLAPHIEKLQGVRGRMTPVSGPEAPFHVLVDYAHTPGSFERLFPMVKSYTRGKIIAVFGSGGERDREKRPLQGEIAARYAGLIILADEDPRGEDPRALLLDIAKGSGRQEGEGLLIIPDRREAIAKAYELAQPGDTVLLLGKGHESSIIGKDGPVPWDEIATAKELLDSQAGPYPALSATG
ncbi:MAG: UDP-N-acetylmuramoyl-L-alanyl-D-glutamate--2,6-diaminopimelate ligase [Spirochaetales bacterium]|jgi:UDP-N-acetylmuramoyl-L-alanyl-D-glutamate--2,6-diaminopimelate ligase|nr:UDP-N-acetylmuramoyl-L-alanyl-D-glutamate--2,6-diaminopimelate ligase [Spirochaetales bacterium]